jgi:hypothetical protein
VTRKAVSRTAGGALPGASSCARSGMRRSSSS